MRLIILLITVLFMNLISKAQPRIIENEIIQIKQTYKNINSSTLKKQSVKYSGLCGIVDATITLYYLNGEIVKITDNGIGNGCLAAEKWNYEYYFKNGKLIFSYEWIKSFDNELGKYNIRETREYFLSNKLIKKIENQKTTYPVNMRINFSDTRYLLKNVKTTNDIFNIFRCF
jgi:hypothetical protein